MQKWNLKPARDLGMPLNKSLRSLQRENGLIATAFHLAFWTCVKVYLKLWHRLSVRGEHHIPATLPFVLVANHSSHLDALVLASRVPWRHRDQTFPIAAGDVFFDSPMTASFAAMMLNALPMWRKKCGPRDLQELRERLVSEPCAYILFPEGTRSRTGAMTRFRPGLGALVAETAVAVVPCYLEGCFEALRPEWKLPRLKRVTLHVGEPVTFNEVANDRAGWISIAETMEARVKRLSGVVATATDQASSGPA
ncbi:MAG: lysophospholipid acyltransferase family protein [Candidatus Hydrogenedentes bacterium]|nr:lysophospholipid acyltransferase family protein [Candidatus Hydrogenedentota bacterium]